MSEQPSRFPLTMSPTIDRVVQEATPTSTSRNVRNLVGNIIGNIIGPAAGVAGVIYAIKGDVNNTTFFLLACTLLMTAQGGGDKI